MRDFKQQLELYKRDLQQMHYPGSEADLDREIRRVTWNDHRSVPLYTPEATKSSAKWWPWTTTAVAACLLAMLLPLGMQTHNDDDIRNVTIDGEHAYFACNNGCSADATIETFKTLMR